MDGVLHDVRSGRINRFDYNLRTIMVCATNSGRGNNVTYVGKASVPGSRTLDLFLDEMRDGRGNEGFR